MVCLRRLGLETLLLAAAPCCLLGKWAPGTAGGLLAPELSYSEQQRKLHPASIFSFLLHMLVNFSFELNVGPTFKACQLKRCQCFCLPEEPTHLSPALILSLIQGLKQQKFDYSSCLAMCNIH